MPIKTILLSLLETDLEKTLNECAASCETLVVEMPDQRLLAIQPLDPREDDALMDELLASNPKLQALVERPKASPRKPLTDSAPGNQDDDFILTGGNMAAFASSFTPGEGGEDAAEKMADFFGPGQVDQTIRQGIHFCWMALPKDRKNPDELEKQIRRIVDRALKDFRDDREQFSRSK